MKSKITLKKYSNSNDFYHLAAVLAQTQATLDDVNLSKHSYAKSGYLEDDLEEEICNLSSNHNFDVNLFHQIQDVMHRQDFFDILLMVCGRIKASISKPSNFLEELDDSAKAILAMKLACKMACFNNNYQINGYILNPVQSIALLLWEIYKNSPKRDFKTVAKSSSSTDTLLFHKFVNSIDSCEQNNLFFKSENKNSIFWPVKKMQLFSSYRLKNKSKQKYSGLDLNLRYFHLYLDLYFGELNCIYWIKLNNEQKPVSGDIIEINSNFIELSRNISLIEIMPNSKELNFSDLLSISSLQQNKLN